MWQAFWAIGFKEILHATRNKASMRMLVITQVLQFTMLAWMDLSVRNMPTVIVDQDRTSESRQLLEHIAATHTFDLKYITSSMEQARGHIRAGRAKVAVVIPPDYSRERAAGRAAQILVLADGSDSMSSSQAIAAIEGVAGGMSLEAQATGVRTGDRSPKLIPHTVLLYNPQGSIPSFMLPGLLAMLLGSAYSMRAMASLAHERDAGNLERLLMTPMNYSGLILGKLVPWFGIGLINAVLFILVMRFGFGIPIRGSSVLLFAVTALYVLTIVALGSYFAASTASAGAAQGRWHLTLFPATMLSGYLFPLASLPKLLLPVSYALPHTHYIALMRGICLRGASAGELFPHVAYLVIAPLLLIVMAARRFRHTVMQ